MLSHALLSFSNCAITVVYLLSTLAESLLVGREPGSAQRTFPNSTTLSPDLAANTTNALVSADSCWSSWDAWSTSSLNCALTTTATSKLTFTEQRSSVIYETYKLCDGHPRANATAPESTSRTTASESGTAYTTYTDVLPPSGIPESTVTTLVTSRATYFETACITPQPSPRCSIGAEECQSLMSAWTAGGFKRDKPPCTVPLSADPCDDCRIFIPTVKLIYFPVTMTGDFCGEYSTVHATYAGNMSVVSTVEVSGQTFTLGSAYLSYAGVTARAGGTDNAQCGTPLPPGVLGLPSSRLSTYRGHAAAMPIASLPPYPLNFADLAPNPVPWDAWISQETCATHQDYPSCQTITQAAYRPWIVYPREFWEMGGESWKKCGSDVFGIMDPPSALPKADEVPMPTMPTVASEDGATATTRTRETYSASPAVSVPRPTAQPTSAGTPVDPSEGQTDSSIPFTSTSHDPLESDGTAAATNAETTSLHPSASEGGSSTTELESDADTSSTFTLDFSFDPVKTSSSTIVGSVRTSALETQVSIPRATRTENSPPASDMDDKTSLPTGDDDLTQTTDSLMTSTTEAAITAPALSILASALSPFISDAPPSVESVMSSAIVEANSILHPDSQSPETSNMPNAGTSTSLDSSIGSLGSTPVVATLGDQHYTIAQTSNRIVLGSAATLSPGQDTTVSGVPVAAYSSAVLVGSTFLPLPGNDGGGDASVSISLSTSEQLPPVVAGPSSVANSAHLPSVTQAEPSQSSHPDGGDGGSRSAVTTIASSSASLLRIGQMLLHGVALLATFSML